MKAFEIAGYGEQTVIDRFGGMYRAFQYGAPPHGGMAAGVDRIVMLLAGEQNLREVALFPMNQRAEDLLMGAPSDGDAEAIARAAHPVERSGKMSGPRLRAASRRVRGRTALLFMQAAHVSHAALVGV